MLDGRVLGASQVEYKPRAQRLAPAQHLVLLRQLLDPGAPPQPQRRAADGHLGALAGGHELAPRLPQVLAPEQPRLHIRGVEAPPLLDGRQGPSPRPGRARAPPASPAPSLRPCACSSARRRPRSTRCGAPSRRVVAVHKVAHGRVAPHAELSHLLCGDAGRLQSWRSMASKSAHTSSTLSCSSSASCRGTQSGLSSKALCSTSPRRAAGSSRSSGPLCAGAGASPCAAQLVHRQPVPALVARAGVPPAAPPATDDHRHVDQVLVVLVAEEAWSVGALRPAGSARASSARCAAGCSRWAPRG